MSEFHAELKVKSREVYGKPLDLFLHELDVYKDFIETNLPGFIAFMEALNKALTGLEDNLIVSNLEFKARFKDAISSLQASDKDNKPLDDIFGFELIAPNETSKELLILLIETMFDEEFCSRSNYHNKSNGYKAYHRVGVVKSEFQDCSNKDIIKYILKKKTKKLKTKFRDLSKKEKLGNSGQDIYDYVFLFPELRKLIREKELSDSTIQSIIEARRTIISSLGKIKQKDIPVVEMQFKTKAVAEEAKYGTASHHGYKPVDEEKLINDYKNGRLIACMHFPLKFTRKGNKMVLQTANLTLFEMYPFLKDIILEYKKQQKLPPLSYNNHFALVFPALKPYVRILAQVEPCHIISETTSPYAVWEILKRRTINPYYEIPESSGHKTGVDRGV